MRLLPLLLLASTTLLSASELPRVEKTPTGSYRMMVDGDPYLILGAQTRNSSGWPEQLEKAWLLYKQLHANTAEIPVYWEIIESPATSTPPSSSRPAGGFQPPSHLLFRLKVSPG